MAYMQDTTQSFTITLVGEGVGNLSQIMVTNETTTIQYMYTVSTATWSPSAPIAYPNDSIYLWAGVENTGVISDFIYAEFVSAEVTPTEPSIQSATVPVGGILDAEWYFVMPATNVNITINAGHEE